MTHRALKLRKNQNKPEQKFKIISWFYSIIIIQNILSYLHTLSLFKMRNTYTYNLFWGKFLDKK